MLRKLLRKKLTSKNVPHLIFTAIRDIFKGLSLSFSNVRGQCYDGAASMAGSKNGVAVKIRSQEPRAVYTHCYGHALNLACSDAIKHCSLLQDSLDVSKEISLLIKESPRSDAIFQSIKDRLGNTGSPGIRVLCPTRWTVKAESLNCIVRNFNILLEVWEEALAYVKDSEMRSRIRGVSLFMRKFDFLFGIMLGECLLRHSDNLSKALQSPTVSAAEGQKMASFTVNTLQTIRDEGAFELFWEKVKMKGRELDISEPKLPRRKQPPKRLDEGQSPHFPKTEMEYFRGIYLDALDLLLNGIKTRFDQPGYGIYSNLESLLLKAASGCDFTSELSSVCSFFGSDINRDLLETQLTILKKQSQENSLTSLSSIVDFLRANGSALFSEIATVVKLLLVMPATNALSERSFSALRRIKNYLRSTMTQKRLNNLMVLSVYKEEVDNTNLIDIANEFVAGNPHRLSKFGHFSSVDLTKNLVV